MTDDEKAAYVARLEQQYKTGKEYEDKQFEESQKALDQFAKPGGSKEYEETLRKEYVVKMKAEAKVGKSALMKHPKPLSLTFEDGKRYNLGNKALC